VTIKARLQGMDTHIEEAPPTSARTSGRRSARSRCRSSRPASPASGLLAFALSVDDFVISNFTAGQTSTFPLFIYGAARQGVPPQVNVLATALLFAVLALMALNVVVQRRRAKADATAVVPARKMIQPGLAQ
jgi:spermidine/putrescine transport system permease protein